MTLRIGVFYFSPTKTTQKICFNIAAGMGENKPVEFNLTKHEIRNLIISSPEKVTQHIDILVVGAPVYTGKLPIQVIDCIKPLKGTGKACIPIVVYGNRDYGLALHNMAEILSLNGFNILGAGAFIGQHSYSDVIPVAIGRPDEPDLKEAQDFGAKCINSIKPISLNDIPAQKDFFSKSKSYNPLHPVFIEQKCSQCGLCSQCCPVGIISQETGNFINKKSINECIGCMACVKSCNKGARITKPGFFMTRMIKIILKKAAVQRQEPLIILN